MLKTRNRTVVPAIEHRVYGPPGTGKTTWIASQVERAVEKFGGDQVSVCSLTRAAVREAAGRDLPIDAENLTTLHARCKRSLGAGPPAETKVASFLSRYPQYISYFPSSMVRGRADPNDDEDTAVESALAGSGGSTVFEEMQVMRQQLIPPERWGPIHRDLYQDWMQWCDSSELMDFTGWLEAALEMGSLPAQQIVFVDEAQDHTPLQLAVVRSWNSKRRVLVGDDDQNLYEWSGAIPQEFYSVEVPPEREIVLSQSYRVPRTVHAEAMRMVMKIRNRKAKEYLPRPEDGKVIRTSYHLGLSGDEEMRGELPPGLLEDPDRTYMILATCGYMLSGILHSLKSSGIPFHNPYRRSNKRWNPLEYLRPRIESFLKEEWTGTDALAWAGALKSGAFKKNGKDDFLAKCEEMGDDLLIGQDIHDSFLPGVAGMLLDRDLDVFLTFRRAGVAGSWDYVIKAFRGGDAFCPRVIVGTVHSVKGGESDVVYLFPDLSRAAQREMAIYDERIYRLFYVGMTRARHTLVLGGEAGISWAKDIWD